MYCISTTSYCKNLRVYKNKIDNCSRGTQMFATTSSFLQLTTLFGVLSFHVQMSLSSFQIFFFSKFIKYACRLYQFWLDGFVKGGCFCTFGTCSFKIVLHCISPFLSITLCNVLSVYYKEMYAFDLVQLVPVRWFWECRNIKKTFFIF